MLFFLPGLCGMQIKNILSSIRRTIYNRTMITHVVVFWTDKPHADNAARLLDAARTLSAIPGVLNFRCGAPTPSPRGAVDDSFSVAISMDFADDAAAAVYQSHPLHQQFLSGPFRDYCRRFVVYDFVDTAASSTPAVTS